ncbi:MAG: hypothetical protein RPS47_07660 [Colwellia sp.]|jgi:hypothetical protein
MNFKQPPHFSLAVCLFLFLLSISSQAGAILGFIMFPGTWYTEEKGIPSQLKIRRFGGATVNGMNCDWEASKSEVFSDAISIGCPNKLPFIAGYMSFNGEYSGRYLEVSFVTNGANTIKGDYYPSLESIKMRNASALEGW